jgi:hypothetical protein
MPPCESCARRRVWRSPPRRSGHRWPVARGVGSSFRTEAFELSHERWTDLEREIHQGWRWWTGAELEATEEIVYPVHLAGLIEMLHGGERPEHPVEVPFAYE